MTRVLIAGNWIDFDLIEQIAKALKRETGAVIDTLKSISNDEEKETKTYSSSKSEMYVPIIMPREVYIEPLKFPKSFWDGDETSYNPRWGCFCKFLWTNPSVIHDMLTVLVGHVMIFFHRKCFMQLKCFVNIRF